MDASQVVLGPIPVRMGLPFRANRILTLASDHESTVLELGMAIGMFPNLVHDTSILGIRNMVSHR
jgi:hypothetical protein